MEDIDADQEKRLEDRAQVSDDRAPMEMVLAYADRRKRLGVEPGPRAWIRDDLYDV